MVTGLVPLAASLTVGAAAMSLVGVFLPFLSSVMLSARGGARFRTQSPADLLEVTFWSALAFVLAGGVEAGEDRAFLFVVVVYDLLPVRGRLWHFLDGLSLGRILLLLNFDNPQALQAGRNQFFSAEAVSLLTDLGLLRHGGGDQVGAGGGRQVAQPLHESRRVAFCRLSAVFGRRA